MPILFGLIVDFSFLREVNDQKLHISCMIFSQNNEIVINFLIYPQIGFNSHFSEYFSWFQDSVISEYKYSVLTCMGLFSSGVIYQSTSWCQPWTSCEPQGVLRRVKNEIAMIVIWHARNTPITVSLSFSTSVQFSLLITQLVLKLNN